MWPSQIKCVVSYFTSRHRSSSLDFLVTLGIWVTDKPNIFTSILQPRTRFCTMRTSQCPLGTLGTDHHAGWVTGLEISSWWCFEAQALSCTVFCRNVGSSVRQALFFSCELSSLLPLPFTDPFAGYVFIAPSLSSVQAELFISWLYVTRCMAVVSGVNP